MESQPETAIVDEQPAKPGRKKTAQPDNATLFYTRHAPATLRGGEMLTSAPNHFSN